MERPLVAGSGAVIRWRGNFPRFLMNTPEETFFVSHKSDRVGVSSTGSSPWVPPVNLPFSPLFLGVSFSRSTNFWAREETFFVIPNSDRVGGTSSNGSR